MCRVEARNGGTKFGAYLPKKLKLKYEKEISNFRLRAFREGHLSVLARQLTS